MDIWQILMTPFSWVQEHDGEEGPAAAAHGVGVVLGVELLDLLVIPLPVIAAPLLNIVGGQTWIFGKYS